ncbi:hypothetical protein [Rheinheimera soli]|uniref:hypothetical protein n=1 Tax=Rheinheimera soli TaxID=443616 RepID=UPI001E4B730F|nr:hypothetical protein [Rheinheimera soli]
MSQDMPKYDVRVGEDSFGIFVEVADFNDYDELEDLFVEQYGLVVIAVSHANKSENGKYKIWLNQSLGIEFVKKIIDEINNSA